MQINEERNFINFHMNICLFKQGEVGHPLEDVVHTLQDFPESRHPSRGTHRRTQQ